MKDAREAKQINVGACDCCPAVHINLFDANGRCFATAVLPIENCEPFIAQIRNEMKSLAGRHSAPAGRQ